MVMNTKKFSKKARQSGFTLVEIAIVLVIIGLILGGVLKGQSLIDNAKYKNFVKHIDSVRAAVLTFQDQYRGLPGDLLNVSALPAGTVQGNGSGKIDGGHCNATGEEACRVWSHLRYAGMIAGDPTLDGEAANPTHSYGGPVKGVGYGNWGNGIYEHKITVYALPGDVAQRYDNEFDDGKANSGDISVYGATGADYNLTTTVTLQVAL